MCVCVGVCGGGGGGGDGSGQNKYIIWKGALQREIILVGMCKGRCIFEK